MTASKAPEGQPTPPVPPEADLRDFQFMPLYVDRLRDSAFAVLTSAEGFRAAILLWCAAWHQVPAGSLPSEDRLLANLAGFGRDLAGWNAISSEALYGFQLCSDDRLYHPLLAAAVVDAWSRKITERQRKVAAGKMGAAKRWGMKRDSEASHSSSDSTSHNSSYGSSHPGANDSAPKADGKNCRQGEGHGDAYMGSEEPMAKGAHLSPEKEFFDFGRRILGKNAGGLISNLLKHVDNDIARARDILEVAEGKSAPREYVGAVLRGDRGAHGESVGAEADRQYRTMRVL